MERNKMASKDTIPPKPKNPCRNCGANDWWLRTGWGEPEYLCGRCHPRPETREEKGK